MKDLRLAVVQMSLARRVSAWVATSPVTAMVSGLDRASTVVNSERDAILSAIGALWNVVTGAKVNEPAPTEAKSYNADTSTIR